MLQANNGLSLILHPNTYHWLVFPRKQKILLDGQTADRVIKEKEHATVWLIMHQFSTGYYLIVFAYLSRVSKFLVIWKCELPNHKNFKTMLMSLDHRNNSKGQVSKTPIWCKEAHKSKLWNKSFSVWKD